MCSWAAASVVMAAAALMIVPALAAPASAVNADQGSQIVAANPADFTPYIQNGTVKSIVQVGSKVVLSARSPGCVRRSTARISRATGSSPSTPPPGSSTVRSTPISTARPTRWTPTARSSTSGAFNTVGGVSARKVAKLTAAGQLVTTGGGASLLRAPNGVVNEVVVRGSRLYIGGAFTTVGGAGTPRRRLAALNTSTGAVLPEVNVPFDGVYDPALGATLIKRMDMSPDGSRLVAVGNFSVVGGQTRSQIAVIDLPATGNASVSPWATDRFDATHNNCAGVFDTFMRDVDFAPGWHLVRGDHHRGVRRRRGQRHDVRHDDALERDPDHRRSSRSGSTTPAVTPPTGSPSPAASSTWAGTCGGRTTRSRATRPVPVPFPARASPRSTPSTVCPCRGTRAGPAESAPKLCTPQRRACGWGVTPTASATKPTGGSRSCHWRAARRSRPHPGDAAQRPVRRGTAA